MIKIYIYLFIFCLGFILTQTQENPRPLKPYVLTPPPDTFIVVQKSSITTEVSIDFNQIVQEGAVGNISITFGDSTIFSTSTQSFWVRVRGATVILTLPPSPLYITKSGEKYGVHVDAGAFVASNSGIPSPEINWSFTAVEKKPFDDSDIPEKPTQENVVKKWFPYVDKQNLNNTIVKLSSYYNRFYDEETGLEAFNWLTSQYQSISKNNPNISISTFKFSWKMPCGIIKIKGENEKLSSIVLGAHLDTINRENWTINEKSGKAPGANDDGSGIALQLEFFRVLVLSKIRILRTIEFHIFSGEEEGLYGSRELSATFRRQNLPIRSFLQLDQCGYLSPYHSPVVAIYQDNTDPTLTTFITKLATLYCPIPWIFSNEDGRADSDFHSYTNMGYRAAYIAEGPVNDIVYGSDKHTPWDIWQHVNLEHVLNVGSIAFAYLIELSSN